MRDPHGFALFLKTARRDVHAIVTGERSLMNYLLKPLDKQKVQGWLATDPMFDSLKADPEFEALF